MKRPSTLNQLAPGERAIVSDVSFSNQALARKLLTMGIVAGTTIEVLCRAPLGDPIQIRALNYTLSLRMSEAAHVTVVPSTRDEQ